MVIDYIFLIQLLVCLLQLMVAIKLFFDVEAKEEKIYLKVLVYTLIVIIILVTIDYYKIIHVKKRWMIYVTLALLWIIVVICNFLLQLKKINKNVEVEDL